MRTLAIATYHYLRDRNGGPKPGLDVQSPARFARQLDYFARHHCVVHPQDVSEALASGKSLPANALMLSFDDGLKEHFTLAHEALRRRGWAGVFYAPVASTVDRRLLTVHKIHLVLAYSPDRPALAHEVGTLIDARRGSDGLRTAAEYRLELARKGRYDDTDTVFVKRALQRALPIEIADEIADTLLRRHVSSDFRNLAELHYLSVDELRQMAREAHEIGGHSMSHRWLDAISPAEKRREIDATIDFLGSLRGHRGSWSFSYPYGRKDDACLELLRGAGCAWAVTTEPRVADLSHDDPLALPRFDTNDFPTDANAATDGFVGAVKLPAVA